MKSISAAVAAGILVLASCSKSNDVLNSGDTQNVNSESVSDSYTNETSDMTSSVVNNVTNSQYGGARVAGEITGLAAKDPRLTGATIILSGTGGSTPTGTITIDFKTGVTTNGVTRVGKIIINYSGMKGVAGSTRVITFNNYSRNNVLFDNGNTLTVTNVTDSSATMKFHHVLSGSNSGSAKLTFPDNTTILRAADYFITLDFTALTLTLTANANVLHSASGTTRAMKDYTMDITAPIMYKAACLASKVYIPVSGKKLITAVRAYTIDYGNGDCDNTVTITVDGKSATITVNADGN
ncbi:MAG TPA: hypothetical protein VKQ08_06600 [Cyclobacteriaceae bacterium]|nr:hypothetical protein [Cyclobacteriaceae bacterium]